MSTSTQISFILKENSLGELASPIKRLTNGWTNITYRLGTKPSKKEYILREYLPGPLRKLSLENIQYEINFIAYLYTELHLPVASMIDPPGIFQLDNANYGVLFPFIDGVKYLDTPETPVRQLWQTLAISRFLGRMHSNIRTKKYPLVPSNRRSVNFINVKYKLVHSCEQFQKDNPDMYRRIRLIIDQHTQSIPLMGDKDEQESFRADLEKNLPMGYIHADIHDDNVLFSSSEQKLAAVLDFDDMYIGPLLIDLAGSLCLWCGIGSKFSFQFAKEFLVVYQKEREMCLTDEEWKSLELYCYLTILHQILFTIESEHHGKPIIDMLNELLLSIEHIAKEKNMFLESLQ